MPKWVNYLVQAVGVLVQIANALGTFVSPKYVPLIAGVVGGIQAIIGGIAHFYNPDGTPAALPYKP